MGNLTEITAYNAISATLLAIVAWIVGRSARRPQLTHLLWLLVLVKLITPHSSTLPSRYQRFTIRFCRFLIPTWRDPPQKYPQLKTPSRTLSG